MSPEESLVAPLISEIPDILTFECPGLALSPGVHSALAWRHEALVPGVRLVDREDLNGEFPVAVIRALRDRRATLADCEHGWQRLPDGGQLLLIGRNENGIQGTARQWQKASGVQGEVLNTGKKSRVVSFTKADGSGQAPPQAQAHAQRDPWLLSHPLGDLRVGRRPGVFVDGALDGGTEVLLEALGLWAKSGATVTALADIPCGSGILGAIGLHYFPEASLFVADGDARAVAACAETCALNGCRLSQKPLWWAPSEGLPSSAFDLVLSNPPWHVQGQVDRGPAQAMVTAIGGALKPGGTALVVGTVTQPFESMCEQIGPVECLLQRFGHKVLAVQRGTA